MNLGNALFRLGERESGTARLEEAVVAYRATLQEWTRERDPPHWARSSATWLSRSGPLESGRPGPRGSRRPWPRIRAALQEQTRELVPLDWAMAQNESRQRAFDPGRAGERDGATAGSGGSVSRRAAGDDARAGAAAMGDGRKQPRQRAFDPGRARERDGAAGGGGGGISRGAGGKDPRADAARMGADSEQPGHCAPGAR